MSSYPTLKELFKAIIKDCYDYLFSHSEGKAKESIIRLLDYNKNKDEIIKKSYVVLCSIKSEIPSEEELSSIYDFTKNFLEYIYFYLNGAEGIIDTISTKNDCCKGYIALFGYIYIFKGIYENEFLQFSSQYYKNFEEILIKYDILNDVKKYYEDIISIKSNEEVFNELVKFMEKEISELKNELQKNENIEETAKLNSTNKNPYVTKKLFNNTMKLLRAELLYHIIKKNFSHMSLLEKVMLNTELNSVLINCGKKRTEYLENLITSTKNTNINIDNLYNFHVLGKLSIIILKNLLIMLYKKNYKFIQDYDERVLKDLKSYASKIKGKELEDSNNKIKKYEVKLKKQSNKDEKYNTIIIVENQIKYSLVIEFLFFLKKKSDKINFFEKEIFDLILFDDLNIDVKLKSPKENIEEEEEKYIYEGKTKFNGKEIITMFKAPFKLHKENINIDKIYSIINKKINEIKEKNGFKNNTDFIQLKNDTVDLLEESQYIIDTYENYFIENKINFKNENEILDIKTKEYIKNYIDIKELKEKIVEKIKLLDNYIKNIKELNIIVEKYMKEVDDLINKIKSDKKRKEHLISISEIFTEFKNDLKDNIMNRMEYKKYGDIFNEKNINEFSLENVFTILDETLNNSNALFSITKSENINNINFIY